jgi:glycosyltransferase involved in cell wall biosynthesis
MDRENPLVSVIVRTKDRPNLLERGLKSITDQNYRPLEIVLVNDGGVELNIDKLKGLIIDIPLNYIRLESNRGRVFAANTGIKNASGKYVCFLDDDDEYYPEHISTLVSAAIQSDYKIVYTDAIKIRRGFNAVTGQVEEDELGVFSSYDFSYIDLITENYIPLTTILFTRRILLESGCFDEEFELYEDWDLLLRVTDRYPPFHVPKTTVKYIFWDKMYQISQDESKRHKYYNKIFNKHRDKFNADVILHLKKNRDVVEREFRRSLDNYKELENSFKELEKGYKNYIDISEEKIRGSEEKIRGSEEKIYDLHEKLEQQQSINKPLEGKVELLEREIHLMVNTIGWRALTKIRRIRDGITPPGSLRRKMYEKIISPIKYKGFSASMKNIDNEYLRWITIHEPDAEALKLQQSGSLNFSYRPKISIIVPVYNTDRDMLVSMINSVLSQTYDNWELCIVDGNSDFPYIKNILLEYAGKDKKIKVSFLERNYNIAGNSNRALELATGEFVTFLDHDDELAPFALYEVVKVLNKSPEIDIIYSDEDKINPSGKRCAPFFKPDWSPDLLMSVNYVCHLLVIRKILLDKAGGFREGYDGAQDYDLVLRSVSGTSKIVHIPEILYHWKMHPDSTAQNIYSKDYAHESGKKALRDYLSRNSIDADVCDGAGITNYRIRYTSKHIPKVSIIIPFKDKYRFLKRCVDSIIQKSSYKNYEFILVSNNSSEKKLIDYLDKLSDLPFVKIIQYNEPFNYSRLNNYAVKHSDGEVLLFLNNDTEVISEDWIESMMKHVMRKEVGAVGCKLLYPDNTIQHAGVIIGLTGFAGHVFSRLPDNAYTYFGSVDFVRNFLAVTGACMMVRRDVFDEVKGFDERFTLCGSDVELCFRLIAHGYRIVYTPFARLYHHEAITRGKEIPTEDFRLSLSAYNKHLNDGDPYYNPNLTRLKTDCSLRTNSEEKILKEIIANALGKS